MTSHEINVVAGKGAVKSWQRFSWALGLFFLIKGMLWLAVPVLIALWGFD